MPPDGSAPVRATTFGVSAQRVTDPYDHRVTGNGAEAVGAHDDHVPGASKPPYGCRRRRGSRAPFPASGVSKLGSLAYVQVGPGVTSAAVRQRPVRRSNRSVLRRCRATGRGVQITADLRTAPRNPVNYSPLPAAARECRSSRSRLAFGRPGDVDPAADDGADQAFFAQDRDGLVDRAAGYAVLLLERPLGRYRPAGRQVAG